MGILNNKAFLPLALLLAAMLPLVTACKDSPAGPATPAGAPYPNADLLVSARWLNDRLGDASLTIIDARKSGDYDSGHIKGAINLDPATLDGPGASVPTDKTDLVNVQELVKVLGRNGVSDKARAVVYGGNIDPNAGRVFWLLEYLGHSDVHVLDGGYEKWQKDGYATTTEKPAKKETTFTASVDASKLATKSRISDNLGSGSLALADQRNASDYAAKRIPGAASILVGDLVSSDKTMKSYESLKTLFESKGITRDKTVVAYCYIGYRSAAAYFAFRLMGYDVSNYDGSWTEWSADSSLPTGP